MPISALVVAEVWLISHLASPSPRFICCASWRLYSSSSKTKATAFAVEQSLWEQGMQMCLQSWCLILALLAGLTNMRISCFFIYFKTHRPPTSVSRAHTLLISHLSLCVLKALLSPIYTAVVHQQGSRKKEMHGNLLSDVIFLINNGCWL